MSSRRFAREVGNQRQAISLRPMHDSEADYQLYATWRNRPHVRDWWDPDDPPMTIEHAIEELRPSILRNEPDRLAIIEVEESPVGFVQYYPWSAYGHELRELRLEVPAGAWGLDIFIGEPDALDRGIGSAVVQMLADELFRTGDASAIAFGVDRNNLRARRAYEKAGMTPVTEYLDFDTRGGKRVMAIFLIRMRAA